MANVQSIYELRAIRQAELDNQLREQKQMTFEEVSVALHRWLFLSCDALT
jgi:hypothetical protein